MKTDIEKITKLSALRLEADEISVLEKEMTEIVEMVGRLPDSEGSLLFGNGGVMEMREDSEACFENCRELIIENAPELISGCFAVPKTVEY